MNSKLIMAILLILVFYFLFRKADEGLRAPLQKSAKLANIIKPHEDDDNGRDEFMKTRRKISIAETSLGVKKFKVNSSKVDFEFAPEKRICFTGDLDLIKMDLYFSRIKKVLISVERLDKPAPPLMTTTRSLTNLYQGFNQQIKMPKVDSPIILGLFICSRHHSTKSCWTKEPAAMHSIYPQYVDALKSKIPTPEEDKVYYFQAMIFDGKTLDFFTPKQSFKKQSKKLNYLLAQKEITRNRKVSKKITYFNQQIVSIEAMLSPNKISLALPFNDPKSCYIEGFDE